jgi:hypothetical protein
MANNGLRIFGMGPSSDDATPESAGNAQRAPGPWRSSRVRAIRDTAQSTHPARLPQPKPDGLLPERLGELIVNLARDDLTAVDFTTNATITACEPVASYSWIDGRGRPTIMVPGQ